LIRRLLVGIGAILLVAAAAPAAPLVREIAWTDPASDVVSAATETHGDCLGRTSTEIETGRALFRSPYVLGGPAARVGLSCEACHAGGRVNARFLLPELSGAAGTADVTSEWSSKTRGDGVRNPVPIPDLSGVSRKSTFGAARDPSLDHFVQGVIVEEFQGPPPSAAAIAGLSAYLRALDPAACTQSRRLRLADLADDVRRALAAARAHAAAGDADTSRALRLAAQDRIAQIAVRLPPPAFAGDRARFESLARELGAGAPLDGDVYGAGWMVRFDAAVRRAELRARRSYFNPEVLRAALSAD
jgi:hypothetical protein